MVEATLVVAMVSREYRLRLVPGRTVVAEPKLTLRVRGGLPMHIEPIRPPVFLPRVELHLFYNAAVFVPMIVAALLHTHPNPAERKLMPCACAVATKGAHA